MVLRLNINSMIMNSRQLEVNRLNMNSMNNAAGLAATAADLANLATTGLDLPTVLMGQRAALDSL